MNTGLRNFAITLLDLFAGIVTLFLSLRFVLRLFAANPNTPFVAWVYDISSSLMSPFAGIFTDLSLGRGAVLDIVVLLSLIVYALLFYILHVLVDSLFSPTSPTVRVPPHTHYAA